jgi:hypothetical protein
MNRKFHASALAFACLASGLLTSCGNSTLPSQTVAIEASSRTTQSVTVGKALAAPLAVTVTKGGVPASGVQVTFAAPSSGASGTFANGANTETDTTDASGTATSSTFTANATTGRYQVTATVTGASTVVRFIVFNDPATTYVFYLSGLESVACCENYYALAGSVSIDASGNVVAGEQDYNDVGGMSSPEPSGDVITGGTLTVDSSTGQGLLTLVTSNPELGAGGTETLGVQFVNAQHALIVQFDGSATSSGSMDLQTASTLSGGYAFTLSGVDSIYYPIAFGGVFSISGTTLSNGVFDLNHAGTVTTGTAFTGSVSTPDSLGRGTITGTGIADTIVYYVVGPEAIRIIDVDSSGSALGSAFGQGLGTFTNASLGSSVFGVEGNSDGVVFAAAGMLTTVPGSGTFQGVADNDEQGWVVWSGSDISGDYFISKTVSGTSYNGYGSLAITSGTLGDLTALGIYMTDPNLNLNDPNSAMGGGGALLLALDPFLAGGMGVVTPQTDTATTSFAGNYAFGAQAYFQPVSNPGWEFDFVGQGSVTSGVLSGTGLVSDPMCFFTGTTAGTYTAVPFSGMVAPDPANPGRYTVTPLVITAVAGSPVDFQVAIYQASGGQLLWVDEDDSSLFLGSLQQQGALTGLPAARRPVVKTHTKRKH